MTVGHYVLCALLLASPQGDQQQRSNKRPPKQLSATIDKSAEAAKDANKRQQQQRAAAPVTPPPAQPDPETLKRERENREREIAIQEAISDFTLMLVIIGAIVGASQVCVAVWTTLVTNKAANAAKKSADAAYAQVLTFINSERAWIDVDFPHVGGPNYSLTVTNVGRTAAHVISWGFGVSFVPPNTDVRPEHLRETLMTKNIHVLVGAQQAEPATLETFDIGAYSGDAWQQVAVGKQVPVFQVSVTYYLLVTHHDVVGKKKDLHKTSACFIYNALMGSMRDLPEYYDHT